MEDVFILLPTKVTPDSLAETLKSAHLFESVNVYDTWDLCILIKSKDLFWDIVRLDHDNENWSSLSDEDNLFLSSHGINDVLCLSYTGLGKEIAFDIIRIILEKHNGYVAYDDDIDDNNFYMLSEFDF